MSGEISTPDVGRSGVCGICAQDIFMDGRGFWVTAFDDACIEGWPRPEGPPYRGHHPGKVDS